MHFARIGATYKEPPQSWTHFSGDLAELLIFHEGVDSWRANRLRRYFWHKYDMTGSVTEPTTAFSRGVPQLAGLVTPHRVTVTSSANGSVSPGSGSLLSIDKQTFTTVPDPGFEAIWKVNGVPVQQGGLTYTLSWLATDATLEVEFRAALVPLEYRLTPDRQFNVLKWDTQPGVTYTIMETNNGTNWIVKDADIPGTGERLTRVYPKDAPMCHFRIIYRW
jgi:hypothetical protein